jgi:outer membrane protein TolC
MVVDVPLKNFVKKKFTAMVKCYTPIYVFCVSWIMRYLFLSLFIFPFIGFSQSRLSLQDAVALALKNNLSVQIATNNNQIAILNNHSSIAGASPIVSANLNNQESVVNINQELNTGVKLNRNAATNNVTNGNVTGTIVLYNGLRIKTTLQRLNETQNQSVQFLNAEILNSIAATHVAYYTVVRQQLAYKMQEKNVQLSKERLALISYKKEAGLANNTDIFQAEIDLNTRQQDLQNSLLAIQQAKTSLFGVINIALDTSLLIIDTIITQPFIALNNVLLGIQNNPQINAAQSQIKINELIEKETTALGIPTLRANAGVSYNRNQANGGQLLLNQSYGPFVSLGLQIPIYNGGAAKRQLQTAKINTQNAKLAQQNVVVNLKTQAMQTHQTYANSLQQISLQKQSVTLSEKLLQLALEKYKLNTATSIELREAQLSYEEAILRLMNLNFTTKLAEIELSRLANTITL